LNIHLVCCELYCGSTHDFKRPPCPLAVFTDGHATLLSSNGFERRGALRDDSSDDCKGGDNLGYILKKATAENVSCDGIFTVNKLHKENKYKTSNTCTHRNDTVDKRPPIFYYYQSPRET